MHPAKPPVFLFVLPILAAACSSPVAPPPSPSSALPTTTALASSLPSALAEPPAEPPVEAPAPSASVDVTSHASPVYESGPSVVTNDQVDGQALMARHGARLRSDLSAVTVLVGDNAKTLGKDICEAVVPKRPPETPILVKPNLCGYDSVKDPAKSGGDNGVSGRTTDVEFTRGVLQCLKARGYTNVTVADGCGHSHKYFQELIQLNGYAAMTKQEGVPLVALDDDGVFDVQGSRPGAPFKITGIEQTHVPTLLMPKLLAEVLDHGLFISVPKLKAHRFSVVSLAIKGMQGTVMYSDRSPAHQQKWRSHIELRDYLANKKAGKEDRKEYVNDLMIFGERMVDVLAISTPDVVLVDGAPGQNGDGFQELVPTKENLAIGGTNPILVDRVGATLLGLWDNADLAKYLGGHKTSPLIELAAKRFGLDLTHVKVVGTGAPLLDQPRPYHFKAMAPFRIDSADGAPAADKPAASSDKPKAYAAPLGSDKLLLDGTSADTAWGRAKPVVWDTDYAGKATGIRTTARFLWSTEALYALFELEGAGLFSDTSRPIHEEREGLYKEDCVELFFTPKADTPQRYLEIELGPFGHFFDLDMDKLAKKSDTKWSSHAEISTARDVAQRRAVIEVALRAKEITAALVPGANLPLGLYRMEGTGNRNYLAWSPPKTPKPNFHVPEAFGVLVIER